MSIEKLLNDHIEALNANTAAIEKLTAAQGGAKSGAAAEEKATTGTTRTRSTAGKSSAAKGSKHSEDETCAALMKLKEDFGMEHAKSILKKHGFLKMGDMTADKYDVIFNAATKLYEELSEGGDEGDDDDDGI